MCDFLQKNGECLLGMISSLGKYGNINQMVKDYGMVIIDIHIRKLEKMYHKRLAAYKKIGYEVCCSTIKERQSVNAIFDSNTYRGIYHKLKLPTQKGVVDIFSL